MILLSAIADYVHYHKTNYKTYGTNKYCRYSTKWSAIGHEPKSGEQLYSSFHSYLKEDSIRKLLMEAQYLEKEYNKLFYPTKRKTTDKKLTFRKDLENIIQKKLDEEFGAVAGTFNPDTLSVDPNSLYTELNNAIKITRDRLGAAKITKTATVNSLLKQIDLIYNILNQNEFKNIVEAQAKIEEAKGRLDTIKNNLNTEISQRGKGLKVKDLNNIEDVETLEELIQEFNRTPLLYKQNRAIFEWIAPFIKIQTNSIAKKNINKTMKSLASPNVKVDIEDDNDNFLKELRSFIDEDVDISAISSATDSKITITYKDSKKGNLTKNIIARNIKTASTEIQILNQTSLYQLLTLSNIFKFSTHYLNLVTVAGGEQMPQYDIIKANRTMKATILFLSMRLYNGVDFLVINDYKKKKIYVYSIKLLLYLIGNNFEYGSLSSNKYSNVINLEDDYTIPNEWEDTVAQRLGKVMNYTRNKKIKVQLTPSVFNIYKDALSRGRP